MSPDACLSSPAFQVGKRRLHFPVPLSILVATDGATSLQKVAQKGTLVRIRPLQSWIVGFLVVGFCGLAARASGLETFQALPPATQYAAPAFTLPDQHGTPMRLDDLRGKVVVVRFWVTW